MDAALKPLRNASRLLSALGLSSLSLTGEIGEAWLAAGWGAWVLCFIGDRYPDVQTRLRRFETPAIFAMIVIFGVDFYGAKSTIFVAITHFLLLFQILKLLGPKTRRDCLQISFFGFFHILTACTLSVDVWHAVVLLVFVPTAAAVLFWNHLARETESSHKPLSAAAGRYCRRLAIGISLSAIPVNALLTASVFLVFPRLTLNASLPGFAGGNRTGYVDQVNLAQKGVLRQESAVVMWLGFTKPEQRERWNGYIQGELLSAFDGKRWSVAREAPPRLFIPDTNGVFVLERGKSGRGALHHTVTLLDTSAATLFVVGKPVQIRAPLPALQRNSSGGLHWLSTWRRPLRYEVVSEAETGAGQAAKDASPLPTAADLEIPDMPMERVAVLAAQIGGRASPAAQAKAIEAHLRSHYRYSTDLGHHVSVHPVAAFLFDRQQGSCGHFASAMALMLRLQKIPARVVAGYLKGEWNEPAQQFLIRERDAHAWVQAYLPNQGWTFFDPTPRETQASSAGQRWIHRFRQYWDYLGLRWNKLIIQYDLYAQLKAFENLRSSSDRFGDMMSAWWNRCRQRFSSRPPSEPDENTAPLPDKRGLAIGPWLLAAAGGVLAVFLFRIRGREEAALKPYRRFLAQMSRAGYPKQPWETGREFAHRLAHARPEKAEVAWRVTEQYYHSRFPKT